MQDQSHNSVFFIWHHVAIKTVPTAYSSLNAFRREYITLLASQMILLAIQTKDLIHKISSLIECDCTTANLCTQELKLIAY